MAGASDREELGMKDLGVAQNALVMLGTEDEDKALTVFLQSRHAAVSLVQAAHAQERIVREAPQSTQGDGRGFRGVRVLEIFAGGCHEISPRNPVAWIREGSKPRLLSTKRARILGRFSGSAGRADNETSKNRSLLAQLRHMTRDTSPPAAAVQSGPMKHVVRGADVIKD